MATLFILGGCAAVGKSTYAKELAEENFAIILDPDEIMKANDISLKDERTWRILWRAFLKGLTAREDMILDKCNFTKSEWEGYRRKALSHKYDVRLIWVQTELGTALERNDKRRRRIDPKIIEKQFVAVHSFKYENAEIILT